MYVSVCVCLCKWVDLSMWEVRHESMVFFFFFFVFFLFCCKVLTAAYCRVNVSIQRSSVEDCVHEAFSPNISLAGLGNAATVLSVNVTDLQPDVGYTVRVNAYNEEGRGMNTDTTVTTAMEGQLL